MDNDLLDLLACELGEIYCWEEECPGVYYLAVLLDAANAEEYYIVLEDAPISQEVRAMGRPLQSAPVLTYLLDSENGAHTAVRYEVLKFFTSFLILRPTYISQFPQEVQRFSAHNTACSMVTSLPI